MGLFGMAAKGIKAAASKVGKQVGGEMKGAMKDKVSTIKKKPFMSLIGAGAKMNQKKKTMPSAFLFLLLLIPATAHAQTTATPGNKLGWTQVGQSVSVAQGATYKVYIDVAAGVTVANHACIVGSPTSNANCTSDLPAMTPGNHAITLTQVISSAESPKSAALNITFVITVTPTGLQIVKLAEIPVVDQFNHVFAVNEHQANRAPRYWKS